MSLPLAHDRTYIGSCGSAVCPCNTARVVRITGAVTTVESMPASPRAASQLTTYSFVTARTATHDNCTSARLALLPRLID